MVAIQSKSRVVVLIKTSSFDDGLTVGSRMWSCTQPTSGFTPGTASCCSAVVADKERALHVRIYQLTSSATS